MSSYQYITFVMNFPNYYGAIFQKPRSGLQASPLIAAEKKM